ncbi:MAG: hypothetical protein EXX96DRAFT_534460 [Benjaminiella poitrasii]|nr:MAG: hypothetical protein EXX96DRAFT_534460 [Benjaminiella poitrasii]
MDARPKKPFIQPYIPVHRRHQQVDSPVQSTHSSRANSLSGNEEVVVVRRRGRGQFRAPSSDDLATSRRNSDTVHSPTNSNDPTDANKNGKVFSEKESIDEPTEIQTKDKSTKKVDEDCIETLISKVHQLSIGSSSEEVDDWEIEADILEKKPVPSISKETKKIDVPVDDTLLPSTTVLDCYDFPNSFKTFHLHDIFKEFEASRGGFNIKWIDDTRALIIFEHPETAKKAYISQLNSQILKIRPYKGQVEKTSSGPIPRRPVTTDMVAKRLVHSALGVRTVKTAEQRQAERELLKAARERRAAERANSATREKQIADAFNE